MLKAFRAKTLEVVGRRAGLEGAAAEHRRARRLDGLCDPDDLLARFDRAGTRHHREVAVARKGAAGVDDRVFRMEGAVGELVGIRNAADGFNVGERLNLVDRKVAARREAVFDVGDVVRGGSGLEDKDHDALQLV